MRLKTILVVLTILFLCISPKAQEDEYGRWVNGVSEAWQFDENLSKEEIENAKSRWIKIGEEMQNPSHEWAGSYANTDISDTHGTHLRWSPQNGFVLFHVNQCTATVQHFSYGKVTISSSAIIFTPEYKSRTINSHKGDSKASIDKWLLVKWRNVPYLIPEEQIVNFANNIAGFGNNPSDDLNLSYFWKINVEKSSSVDDLPIFPTGYEKYVKKPLEAKIIKVGKRIIKQNREDYSAEPIYESHTQVTINLGQVDGVKKGMKFYILKSSATDAIEIKRVNSTTSTGVVVRSIDDDSHSNPFMRKDLPALILTEGLDVTTSDYKHSELYNHDFHIRKKTN